MSSIEHYVGGGSSLSFGSTSRGFKKEVARITGKSSLRMLQVEAEAEIGGSKVQAVGYVGTKAQQSIAMMSQIEGDLIKAVPLAANRLEQVGNLTTTAMSEVVFDTVHAVRRI